MNKLVERLHVRVVRGSQKPVAEKNRIKSLQNHTEPLKEELGIIITVINNDYYNHGNHGKLPVISIPLSSADRVWCLLICPSTGAEYCDRPVCLCVCLSVSEHISGTAGLIGMKFCGRIPCGLLRQHCATLCTLGFMDDVTFGRNGRNVER